MTWCHDQPIRSVVTSNDHDRHVSLTTGDKHFLCVSLFIGHAFAGIHVVPWNISVIAYNVFGTKHMDAFHAKKKEYELECI